MPTDEELDAMAVRIYGDKWSDGKLGYYHGGPAVKAIVMQLAIAAKHAKAACDLAEDSANYMARIVM